jgi:Domain of unknown function (DUF4396)
MIYGAIWLWFILTFLAVAFVAIDIRSTPESPVLKWGFVLVTLFTGPLGAFLYVLGCREPLPGLHEKYVAAQWRQTLGSTMHCVAGDGVGIMAGAVIGGIFILPKAADITLEYLLGFLFGWGIFQALFMRDMAGGSYLKSLRMTLIPELLSMNCLMAGMIPVSIIAKAHEAAAMSPLSSVFWFVMSVALTVGAFAAYPMNWWLVANRLKHGMLTVRPPAAPPVATSPPAPKLHDMPSMTHDMPPTGSATTATSHAMPSIGGGSPAHDMSKMSAAASAHDMSKMGAAAPMDHDTSNMPGMGASAATMTHGGEHSGHQPPPGTPPPAVARMTVVSFAALAAGILLAIFFS